MFDIFRAVTVHPALIHFTIGTIPVIILAYALAFSRRSDRWSFVGDVTLVVTATLTLVTATFGAVANWTLDWPGGLGIWRWAHAAGGVLSTVVLVAFAWVRVRARRRAAPMATWRTFAGSLALGLVVLLTGWVGGEMLVFHAGMGVEAAGLGALSPPVVRAADQPRDVDDAMHRLRASYAAATTWTTHMIVHQPSQEAFIVVEQGARDMGHVASWLARGDDGAPAQGEAPSVARVAGASLAGAAPLGRGAEDDDGDVSPLILAAEGHGEVGAAGDETGAAGGETGEAETKVLFRRMARSLGDGTASLAQAAAGQDLAETVRALGEVGLSCTRCHEDTRWSDGAH